MLAICREYVICYVYQINFMEKCEIWTKIVEIIYK